MILNGIILKAQSGFFLVETDQGQLTCQLRGRLKKEKRTGDIAAVGDRVLVEPIDSVTGMINEIQPRKTFFARLDPTPHGVYRQILLANPDQALFIFACANPAPHLRMLDRFLVIAEKQQIPAVIVASKTDLVGEEQAASLFGHYTAIGYRVIYVSLPLKKGIEDIRDLLLGKITAFTGPSGVGKSSMLNAVQPGLGLATRDISEYSHKGRHTTVVRQMYPVEGGGYVVDTPGIKSLSLWDMEPEELDGYFREISPLVSSCQFNDCTHRTEPGCAVREAVRQGQVHPERYRSYLRMRYEEEDLPEEIEKTEDIH
jgi:ribosome biogenesis GTPase